MGKRMMAMAAAVLVGGMICQAAAGAVAAKSTPLAAKWEYSMDGGKTFSPDPPTITGDRVPNEAKDSVVARAAFTIDDPARLGLLKLITGEADGAVALTDAESVDRYNIGRKPNLLKMKLVLNGKETNAGMVPFTLYKYAPIDPQLLVKGTNTLTVSGVYWFQMAPPMPAPLRFETLPADVVELDRLPVLGFNGEDSFSVVARSVIPAEFIVTTQVLDPPGAEPQQQKVARARQLKARFALPKGAKRFSYTVAVQAGGASKTYGPYEARSPVYGEGFRFAVAGNTTVYQGETFPEASDRLKNVLAKLEEVHPDVFIHIGKYVDIPPWDWMWTDLFFGVRPETLARIPLMPVCGQHEMMSPVAFQQQFSFPADDQDFGHWTVAIGKVRFVAIESWSMSQDKTGASLKWLDKVLSEAKEDYVVLLSTQVSHCSTPNAGRAVRPTIDFVAKNVNPLLVKHQATVAVGGHHVDYERAEPPPGEGVPVIMTCMAGGTGKPLHQVYVDQNKHSKAVHFGDHFVLFEVKKDKLVMQAMDLSGKVFDSLEFAPRKQ